jgi:hypothetical protein
MANSESNELVKLNQSNLNIEELSPEELEAVSGGVVATQECPNTYVVVCTNTYS